MFRKNSDNYIDLFKNEVLYNPEKIAINSYNEKISYKDLDSLLSKIENNLNFKIEDKSQILALSSDGSIFHFAVMLACIKAKITFINIDLAMPKNYIATIIEDLSITTLILSKKSSTENFSKELFENILFQEDLEKDEIFKVKESEENKVLFIVPTSGSTGKAKYVEKTMQALMQSYKQFKKKVNFLFSKDIDQLAPLNFAFGLELSLIFLASGSKISIDEKSDYLDINLIFKNIKKNKSEIAFWPSPVIKLLSRQSKEIAKLPENLKYIIVGGETVVVSADLIFEFEQRNIKLLNNYGCTEVGTIFFSPMEISLFDVEEFNTLSFDEALSGFEVFIFDENFHPCNKGKLYIKAKSFENKYYKEKDIFFKIDKYENALFYDSKDICEYKNGRYYILGREKNCVNIKGYRVEIESVEVHISKILKGFENCVIKVQNAYEEISLICFYDSKLFHPLELRSKLAEELPEYMLPKLFIQIDNLPHLKNGKIDRQKVYKIYEENYKAKQKEKPQNLREELINALESILAFKIKDADKNIPLKNLGLDSLGFVDFISLLEEKEKINIADNILTELFQSNIEELASYILKKKNEKENL